MKVSHHDQVKEILSVISLKQKQDIVKMRFEDVLKRVESKEISAGEGAYVLQISPRTFQRYRRAYEEGGLDGLDDGRLNKRSNRAASDEEVKDLCQIYEEEFKEFNVRHFHSIMKEERGLKRSYSWAKKTLQFNKIISKGTKGKKCRQRRVRRPMEGMLMHQDGSTHLWIEALGRMIDLIVTMDDATSTITSAFFVDQEGTESTLRGISETIERYGIFCEFYTDRGSHYFYTPESGGKVSKKQLTHVGMVLKKLGIIHVESYSPQGRGRSERMFGTLQGRLPQELKRQGIKTIEEANIFLRDVYIPKHNREFSVKAAHEKSCYVPFVGDLRSVMAREDQRIVRNDNTIAYEGLTLQLAATEHRYHYVKATVNVKEYMDGQIDVFYGPHRIASFNRRGERLENTSPMQNLKAG